MSGRTVGVVDTYGAAWPEAASAAGITSSNSGLVHVSASSPSIAAVCATSLFPHQMAVLAYRRRAAITSAASCRTSTAKVASSAG